MGKITTAVTSTLAHNCEWGKDFQWHTDISLPLTQSLAFASDEFNEISLFRRFTNKENRRIAVELEILID